MIVKMLVISVPIKFASLPYFFMPETSSFSVPYSEIYMVVQLRMK